MFKKKTKVIAVITSVLLLAGMIVLLTLASAEEAAKRAAEASRTQIKQTFMDNEEKYTEISSLIKDSFVYDEVCIIFSEDGPSVKTDYSIVSISDKELRERLVAFTEITKTHVIYYDGEQTFFKTEFSNGRRKSEANIIIRDDLQKPDYGDCEKLIDDWYYTEMNII